MKFDGGYWCFFTMGACAEEIAEKFKLPSNKQITIHVENIRCGGNDLQLGFYAAEWNGLCGDPIFVLGGDKDHN